MPLLRSTYRDSGVWIPWFCVRGSSLVYLDSSFALLSSVVTESSQAETDGCWFSCVRGRQELPHVIFYHLVVISLLYKLTLTEPFFRHCFVIILWASELCKERKSGEETASYFVQGKDSIIKQNRAAIIIACPVDWKLCKSPLKSKFFFLWKY